MGAFDKYSVDDIREIVEHDRPEAMHRQAVAWSDMAGLLDTHATGLDNESAALAHQWTGQAANLCRQELSDAANTMREAAATAESNAQAWAYIAEVVAWTREEVMRVHDAWQSAKTTAPPPDQRYVPEGIDVVVEQPRESDDRRGPFDEAAQTVMNSAAEAIGEHYDQSLVIPATSQVPTLPPNAGAGVGILPHPSGAEGDANENDDSFFGTGGPEVNPLLQGGTHTSTPLAGGGGAPGSGAVSGGAPGSGPILSSAPMQQPVTGDRFTSADSAWAGGDDEVRGSRAPKKHTGDNAGASRLSKSGRQSETPESEVERLSRRKTDRDDDDNPWQPDEPVVPGVITDTAPKEPPHHDPGPVAGGR